jgi:hypothetical protein
LVVIVSVFQEGQHFATEHAAEHRRRKEVARPTSDPVGLVGCQAAGRNPAMQVGMMFPSLIPSMEYGEIVAMPGRLPSSQAI